MKLFAIGFLFGVVHLAAARTPLPDDVNELCETVRCADGKVCRVIEKCGKKRKSMAKCLPCVPSDADKVCNDNRYLRVVLGGSPRKPTPLSCHLHDVSNKFECPPGSACVPNPDSPGHGFCCYGRVYDKSNRPVTNDDPECSRCKPPCRVGHMCMEDVVCGQLKHVCKAIYK